MDPETFRREAHRARGLDRRLPRDPSRYPVLAQVAPGDVRRQLPAEAPAERRAVRRDLRGLREDHPAGRHALEPSRVLRLLRDHRQRTGRPRRVPLRRAQSAGDAVAHVAGRDGARRGDAALAAAPDAPAGRVRRRHLRHRLDLDAARAGRGARARGAGRPRARPGRARGPWPLPRLLLRPDALLDRQGGDPARPRPRGAAEDSDATQSSGCESTRCARRSPRIARGHHADGRRRDDRVDVDDERGSAAGDRRALPRASGSGCTSTPRMPVSPQWCRASSTCSMASQTADSLVVNPHKWLFTPFDLSVLYCRHMDVLRGAFSLVPEYLRTTDPSGVRNLMDTGIQLGRRFRALKLWMVMRHFGAEGLRAQARGAHAARAAVRIVDRREPRVRAARAGPIQRRLLPLARPMLAQTDEASGSPPTNGCWSASTGRGEIFISHTRLNGRFAIRLAIGNLHTTEAHVARLGTDPRARESFELPR